MSDVRRERPGDRRDGRRGHPLEIEQRESGAHATVLQSKQSGVSLYERMGYRKVTRFSPTEAFPVVNSSQGAQSSRSSGNGSKWLCSLSKETYITLLAALGVAWYLVGKYLLRAPVRECQWPLFVVLVIGGGPLMFDLLRKMAAAEFGSDLLAGLSILTSVILGQYLAGSIVVLMLSGGTALEQYATRRASAVLGALAKRMPSVAHRRTGSQIEEIGLGDVHIGDLLVVLPHEICPVDGTVSQGRGTMDESYLTGEPYQISKVVGAEVLSGAVNGDTALTIKVERLPVDSRYAKITRVMQEAEMHRPRFRRIADRMGSWYTLLALAIAAIAWIAGRDPTRFLAVLVIATPCPLLLAIPVAIIGAISVAASRGIIIKNPAMLERIDSCRTMIFDKTGTLTYGRPVLVETLCAPGVSRDQAIRMAASLEQYSKHPLAASIREAAQQSKIGLAAVSEISEKRGAGLSGTIGTTIVQITGRKKVPAIVASTLPPAAPGMECILMLDGKYSATFRFRDAPRQDSRSFIRHLAPKHKVNRVILLSGDRETEVQYLAGQVGITEALFGKSPEEKVAIIREAAKRAPTLFVGDGINDAPAMQAATVGIAFGQNSDVTAEAADAVVLEASLRKVDELIHIGRRMRKIGLQSAVGGMGLSMVGMLIAAAGYLPPVAGAVAQELIDVAAVLNAVRVALPSDDLRDDGV
ncbi:MAG TPA: heavy metal translocating P-type ATPase [Bryobacteraceae bacterium]|nr:heavy metal translocating P-type ATPase [Bryobacteraceae bacterium]